MKKLLSTLAILAFCAICYGGAYAFSPIGNHDEYIRGALQFYTLRITPSIEESDKYLQYAERKWRKVRCIDTCYQAGYDVGYQYIAYNQRITP